MRRDRIKVFGVGGGGANAISRLMGSLTSHAELWAVNTDAGALAYSQAELRLHIGARLLGGLGANGSPSVAARAARESYAELAAAVADADVVVLLAGLGGGTGTGGSPVLAEAARAAGAVVVAIVTLPFAFEGQRRQFQAEAGCQALREQVDFLAIVPNDALPSAQAALTSMQETFALGDAFPAAFVSRLSAAHSGEIASAVHASLAEAAGDVSFTLPPLWVRPGLPPLVSDLSPALALADGRTGLEPSF